MADLHGIGFIPQGIAAGFVEQLADIGHFPVRDLKDFFERSDFVFGNPSVGFGHFCAENDNGDGEGGLARADRGRPGTAFEAAGPIHHMSGRGANDCPQRSTEREAGNAAN